MLIPAKGDWLWGQSGSNADSPARPHAGLTPWGNVRLSRTPVSSKKFAFGLFVALGCANGREISLDEVIVLTVLPDPGEDAGADAANPPLESSRMAPLPLPEPDASVMATPPASEATAQEPAAEALPAAFASDAAPPLAGDTTPPLSGDAAPPLSGDAGT